MRPLPDYCLRYHQNSEFRCDPCNREFRSKDAIVQHLSNSGREEFHRRENHYKCKCEALFNAKEEFLQHLQFSEVHISSLHNFICQGDTKKSQKLCRFAEDLDRKCRSHDVTEHEDRNQIGNSPLHCAVLNKFDKCAKNLLSWGANPNQKDVFGRTPVHIAVARGKVKIVLKLLAHDGNLFELDDDGQTPYDIARKHVKQDILQSLFIFSEQNGVVQATGMKNPRLAELVIKQFEDYKRMTRVSEPSSPSGNLLTVNYSNDDDNDEDGDDDGDGSSDDDDDDKDEQGQTISYKDLVNNDSTKLIYSDVVEHGKEKITHGKVLVLGQVGSGKSSLVRNLSGKQFKAGRVETEGIESFFVNTVNLDQSWQEVEDTGWTCDEAVARHVAECLFELLVSNRSISKSMTQLAIADSPPCTTLQCDVKQPISIEDPVKEKIIANLENPKCCKEQLKLTIWDFAGHALYQTMHHIFLSSKAMYLLCFSLVEFKKDQVDLIQELDFWLNSIAAHKSACEPAVFVVATHIDRENDETLQQANSYIKSQLFDKFSTFIVTNNRDISFPIDNTKGPTDERLRNLQLAIQKEAQISEDCSDEMAIRWLICEKELYRMIHDDFNIFSKTKKELREYLQSSKCKALSDKEFQNMLEAFHHSGVLWLPELLVKNNGEIGDLADVVILNVQHLMDAMTAICQLCCEQDSTKSDRHHRKIAKLLKTDAKISYDDLKKILDKFSAPTDQMIELLRIFNILLPAERIQSRKTDTGFDPKPNLTSTPNAKNASKTDDSWYVIPSLMQDECLESYWQEFCRNPGEFLFYIDFFEFVPEAVFHQFLVQLAEYSIQSGGFDPILRKFDAIFNFKGRFTFRLQFIKSYCQVKGRLIGDCGGKPGELMVELKEILTSVCENFFRFQRFKIGPLCPFDNCPGSNPDGTKVKKIQYENDEEDGSCLILSRPFVIDFNPKEIRPIYCGTHRVDENTEVQRWVLQHNYSRDESQNDSNQEFNWTPSTSVDSGVEEALSASLFVVVDKEIRTKVSEKLGDSWIKLGRSLEFSELADVDVIIENVRHDYRKQQEQGYQLLSEWCKDRGEEATVAKLKEALENCQLSDVAEKIRRFSFPKVT